MGYRTRSGDVYNYEAFDPEGYFREPGEPPERGTSLEEARVWELDGSPQHLTDLGGRFLVVETGSTTCPLYRHRVRRMRKVASKHPQASFVVLYTREAHPGERRGPHASLEDKRRAAAALPDEAGEWRRIVVDDLEGSLHRRLGALPNSVTILDDRGTVLAHLRDNDPEAVDRLLARLSVGRDAAAVEVRFRPPSPRAALGALLTGGWLAMWDFVRGLPKLIRHRFGRKG